MTAQRIGILHPGAMGISIAASAQKGWQEVYWASQGRSAATHERAERFALIDAGTVAHLCSTCNILFSICPPHVAEDVARQVIGCGFRGLYLDANAIAPQHATRIGQALEAADIGFVDGGIIGGPAWEPGKTWLYLAGPRAGEVASCFVGAPLQTVVLGEAPGAASALKMFYAAYTKGSTALLTAALGAADALGVLSDLEEQWRQEGSGLDTDAPRRARSVTAKAWRFVGEMEEIAATFEGAGLPGGFHAAAAEVYRRLACFKDADKTPALDEVLAALRGERPDSH